MSFEMQCGCGARSGLSNYRKHGVLWAWWHAWRSPRCRGPVGRMMFGDPHEEALSSARRTFLFWDAMFRLTFILAWAFVIGFAILHARPFTAPPVEEVERSR